MAYSDVIALGPAVILDPSDLTSIYQSRLGGSNGASGQPVGVWLDKSQMGDNTAAAYIAGRSELVTNGDFSGGSTGWTVGAGWSISGGVATASASSANLTQNILTTGSWYRIEFTISGYSAGTIRAYAGLSSPGDLASANGSYVAFMKAAGDTTLYLAANGFTGTIDNVSVKQVPGNHFLAVSDAGRPTLQERGGLYAVDYDGTNDRMTGAVQFGAVAPRAILAVAFDNFGSPAYRPVFDNGRYFIQGRESGGNYHPRYTTAGKLDYDFTTLTTPKGNAAVWSFAIDAGWDITATSDGVSQTVAGTMDSTNSAYGIEIGYGQTFYMDGRIWAMALFDKDLTSGEQATVEAWAASKCKFIASADAGAFAFTGQDATLTYAPITGYSLSADSGSFGVTGQAAGLLVGRKVAANGGAFAYAGQTANTLFGRLVTGASGSFGFAGQDAGFSHTYVLASASASFAFTGQDATLTTGARSASAEAGAFAFAGQDATLKTGRLVGASSTSFGFAGQAASTLVGRALPAAFAQFAFTGQDASFRFTRVFQAETGAFAFAGQDADLRKAAPADFRLTAESGVYAYAGAAASLTGPLWRPVEPISATWAPVTPATTDWTDA